VDLYLVRHAIAEPRDTMRWPDDSVRPLAPAGIERFRRAARGLRRIAPTVDLVLASPYVRAWQTAELLRDEAGWPEPERCRALAAGNTRAAVEGLEDRADRGSVALVGHEPNLSSLASFFLAGDEVAVSMEMKKGGVALLSFSGAPAPRSGLLRWSVSPKILRSLAS
jgi:phosphohistidine phosphatase